MEYFQLQGSEYAELLSGIYQCTNPEALKKISSIQQGAETQGQVKSTRCQKIMFEEKDNEASLQVMDLRTHLMQRQTAKPLPQSTNPIIWLNEMFPPPGNLFFY